MLFSSRCRYWHLFPIQYFPSSEKVRCKVLSLRKPSRNALATTTTATITTTITTTTSQSNILSRRNEIAAIRLREGDNKPPLMPPLKTKGGVRVAPAAQRQKKQRPQKKQQLAQKDAAMAWV